MALACIASLSLATTTLSVITSKATQSRLGLRICGLVWIASLSLAMTTSSIRLSVGRSGAKFLPRFVTFQGLAAGKTSERFRRGKFAELGSARLGPKFPALATGTVSAPVRKSEVRSRPTAAPRLYDRIGDEITLDEVERIARRLAQPEQGLSSKRWRRPQRCRHGDGLGCRQCTIASRP